MRVLAIDFGTSNTVAAVSQDGAPPRLLTIDGSPMLPSSIYLSEDGTIAVGRDADRQARIDPSRYEPNPKRRIDDGEMLLGSDVIPVRQAIAAVLGRVLQEFKRQHGGAKPDVVRLTHPARWRKTRRDVLVAACREAGLSDNPILVPEPVGAATHFVTQGGHNLSPGQALAVYDLGGGTFDVAIVQKTGEGFEVIAEDGLPDLGGLDFDHAILEHVGRTQEATDPDAWAKLSRPTDTASRRAQRALAVDIREGKEALSRNPHTDIAFPAPFADVHITRSEFEELIRPNLARSVEKLVTTISDANLTPNQLAGVYLVGGSSRVPLVARLIQEGMGVTPTTLDQPEATVATGALYLTIGGGPSAAAGPVGTAGPPPGPPRHAGPPSGPGVGGATRRIDPVELQRLTTTRSVGPGANVRRLPMPAPTGPGSRPPITRPPGQPPSGPQQRPPTGAQQRPPTGPQRPPTGAQRPPATGPHRPATGASRPPTGSVPAAGPPRPASGAIARPASPPTAGGAPPGATPPRTAARSTTPPGSTPARPAASSTGADGNAQTIIWIAIIAVAVILLIILITQLA